MDHPGVIHRILKNKQKWDIKISEITSCEGPPHRMQAHRLVSINSTLDK